jgi:excisionase family DNA binding protein
MKITPAHSPTLAPRSKSGFCTTRDAARALGISLRTAQLWVEGGILEAWKTEGGHRRISVASIERLRAGERPGPAATVAVSPVPVASGTDSRLRILVVEDDMVLLKLYKMSIGRWELPIDLECVSNGYEALLAIGRNSPDLLVSDLRMPGMDGFRMIRALSGSPYREGMEIVVVSALTAREVAQEGGLPPDILVFGKPVSFQVLRGIAESLLARRAALIESMRAPA